MSPHDPDRADGREPGALSHSELELSERFEKSLTGSAQTVEFEPGESFEAPSMALDNFEPEHND